MSTCQEEIRPGGVWVAWENLFEKLVLELVYEEFVEIDEVK